MAEYRNALPEGHRIHWYVIRRVLGQGGFGITYLAGDTNLDRTVAIKEYLPMDMAFRENDASVHPHTTDIAESFNWGLDRFISEAQTLARFKHPNIVHVFSVFRENNTAYMVMEYEQGQGLDRILKERKTLPEAELLNIILPLLDGLEQVHGAGFIHRDIKPPNIYIRDDGSPVLLDFGSARQSLGERTQTLTAMFSPGFAPFEQYTGKGEHQGPWTDIYGLGATLYRAVTGRSPPNAMDRSEALLHTSRDIFVPAAEIRPAGYSPALLEAIDWSLSFRHEDRPASIAAWRDSLVQTRTATAAVPARDMPVAAAARQEAGTVSGTVATSRAHRTLAQPANTAGGWKRRTLAAAIVAVLLVLFIGRHGHRSDNVSTATAPAAAHNSGADVVPSYNKVPDTGGTPAAAVEAKPAPAAGSMDSAPVNKVASRPDTSNAATESGHVAPGGQNSERIVAPADNSDFQRLEQLRRRLQQNPRDPGARKMLRTTMKDYGQRIREAVANRQYDQAETYVKQLLAIAPDNQKLRHSLQRIREMSRRR